MTTTTTGFDEHALARLVSPAPFVGAIRAKAVVMRPCRLSATRARNGQAVEGM